MARARILFEIPKLEHTVGVPVDVAPDPARALAAWLERAGDKPLAERIRKAALSLQETAAASADEEESDEFLSKTITLDDTEADVTREALERWVGPESDLARLYGVLHQIDDLEENPLKSDRKSDREGSD